MHRIRLLIKEATVHLRPWHVVPIFISVQSRSVQNTNPSANDLTAFKPAYDLAEARTLAFCVLCVMWVQIWSRYSWLPSYPLHGLSALKLHKLTSFRPLDFLPAHHKPPSLTTACIFSSRWIWKKLGSTQEVEVARCFYMDSTYSSTSLTYKGESVCRLEQRFCSNFVVSHTLL